MRFFSDANIVKVKQAPVSALILVGSDSPWSNMFSMISSDGQSGGFLLYLLIMGGILLIIGVLIYNWWEEKRFNEQVSKSFSDIDDDALLDQNKQAFLDKFAATTGYLSDGPEVGELSDDGKHPFDDKQSIDEVYSELLETIAKRTSNNSVLDENGNITIDHDSISDPFQNVSNEQVVSTMDDDGTDSIYIPEVVHIEDEAEGQTDSDNNSADGTDQILRKKESIRNIINQAFKAKYNPNYKKVVDVEADDNTKEVEAEIINDEPLTDHDGKSSVVTNVAHQAVVEEENIRIDDLEVPNLYAEHAEEASIDVADDNVPHNVDEIEFDDGASSDEASLDEVNEDQNELESVHNEPASSHLIDEEDSELDIKFPDASEEVTADQSEVNIAALNMDGDQSADEASTNEESQEDSTDQEVLLMPREINSQMDLVGELEIANVSPAANILETFARIEHDYDKPTFVFAQSSTNKWVMLNNASDEALTYHFDKNKPIKIVAAMQLADRSGPATKNTIQRFKNALETNAKEMGYKAHWLDTQDPVEKASALDAFCIDVDKTMFFHILNDGTPFTGIKLRGLAESQGMELTNDGSFKCYASAEALRKKKYDFMLFNRDNHRFTPEMLRTSVIKAVTFQLDIPQIGADGKSLERMIEIAQHLKNNLNATLVDDNNRPLSDNQMVKIREQIKSIHATMQLRGIVPGSDHAFRLFS